MNEQDKINKILQILEDAREKTLVGHTFDAGFNYGILTAINTIRKFYPIEDE